MTDTLDGAHEDVRDDPREGAVATQQGPDEPDSGIVWPRLGLLIAFFGFLIFVGGKNTLAFVVALVAALVIHEAGHFLVGRWSGMKVTEYFIGFGPRIFSFTRGETTYGLKAIPAGAYVRIIGMNNLEDVDPVDEPRTYRKAAWHKRVLTILAGPATHFVVALVLMFVFLARQGEPIPEEEAWGIGVVVPFSAAEEAGLQSGDQIVRIDGIDTLQWDSLALVIPNVSGSRVQLDILRDGDEQSVEATIGERLTPEGARGYSGLYEGDLVVAIEGQSVANYAEFADLAGQRVGESVEVDVVYRQELHTELITINSVPRDEAVIGFLGVSQGTAFQHLGTGEAFQRAPGQLGSIISDIAERTPQLVTSKEGLRSLFGLTAFDDAEPASTVDAGVERRPLDANFDENRPISLIGITFIADALEDPNEVLFLIIVVNLFFGLFNLLPLLPLDGGHILLATYERVRSIGRGAYEADAAKLLPLTYLVFGLMMLISTIAMLRDIQDFVL
jgi:RIP metalloprotease RseP